MSNGRASATADSLLVSNPVVPVARPRNVTQRRRIVRQPTREAQPADDRRSAPQAEDDDGRDLQEDGGAALRPRRVGWQDRLVQVLQDEPGGEERPQQVRERAV